VPCPDNKPKPMLRELKVNDQTFWCDFGLNAIRQYCKLKNIELFQFDDSLKAIVNDNFSIDALENLALITKLAIENGMRRKNLEVTISQDDVIDWMSDKSITGRDIIEIMADGLPKPEDKKDEDENQGETKPQPKN